jgi:hypothetical protein
MLHLNRTSPNKRKSPTPCGEGLPMCQLGGDTPAPSRNALRQQFLRGRCGVSEDFAALIAPMIWETRRD